MSYGHHTIYLRAVDKYGNEDETPATWSFDIQRPRTYPSDYDDDDDYHKLNHKDIFNKIEDSEDDVQDTVHNSENRIKKKVEDSEHDVKARVEDSEDDVIFAFT
jgi:hypothetical protein